jgi:hypothetical protein
MQGQIACKNYNPLMILWGRNMGIIDENNTMLNTTNYFNVDKLD